MYAVTRSLDPATGEVVFSNARASWDEGHPALEILARVYRTPKGSAQRDPEYGIDLDGIDPASPSAAAQVEHRMRAAAAKYVAAGLFTIESVKVEPGSDGEGFVWRVEIIDPRERPRRIRDASGTFRGSNF